MKELLVRTAFTLLLVLLYVVGNYLNPLFKQHFEDLDIAPLLPLLLLVYLPYLVQRLSPHQTTFTLARKPTLNSQRLVLPLRIHHEGNTSHVLTINEVMGPPDANVFLQLSGGADKPDHSPSIPEGTRFTVGPQQPLIEFDLVFDFRCPPKPHPVRFPRSLWTRAQCLRVVLKANVGIVPCNKTWHIPMEAAS